MPEFIYLSDINIVDKKRNQMPGLRVLGSNGDFAPGYQLVVPSYMWMPPNMSDTPHAAETNGEDIFTRASMIGFRYRVATVFQPGRQLIVRWYLNSDSVKHPSPGVFFGQARPGIEVVETTVTEANSFFPVVEVNRFFPDSNPSPHVARRRAWHGMFVSQKLPIGAAGEYSQVEVFIYTSVSQWMDVSTFPANVDFIGGKPIPSFHGNPKSYLVLSLH